MKPATVQQIASRSLHSYSCPVVAGVGGVMETPSNIDILQEALKASFILDNDVTPEDNHSGSEINNEVDVAARDVTVQVQLKNIVAEQEFFAKTKFVVSQDGQLKITDIIGQDGRSCLPILFPNKIASQSIGVFLMQQVLESTSCRDGLTENTFTLSEALPSVEKSFAIPSTPPAPAGRISQQLPTTAKTTAKNRRTPNHRGVTCPLCSQSFCDASSLKRHTQMHNTPTVYCDVGSCRAPYKIVRNLTIHKEKIHKIAPY